MRRKVEALSQRGFTLLELAITVAIVALLSGVSIPVIDNITRADLRASASKTAGMMKAIYDLAVLSGKPCRLVIDMKANTITAEIASDRMTIGDGDMTQKDDDDDNDKGAELHDRKAHLVAMAKRHVGKTKSVKKTVSFTRAPGTVPFKLPSNVSITEVAAEHLRKPEKEGKVSLFFFPMGYCEHALIHFEDTSERVFSLEVEPLTARTHIVDKRIEYKEEKER